MNIKPTVAYHIDKLELIFEVPDDFYIPEFISVYIEPETKYEVSLTDEVKLWNVNPVICLSTSLVFIFQQGMPMEGKFRKKNPPIEVYIENMGEKHLLGVLKTHLEGATRLEIDNEFLYRGPVKYLKLLEERLRLKLYRISKLDVCADANQNLPRKLNDYLHSSHCVVTRPGSKKSSWQTDRGNMILGKKVSKNIKILTKREYFEPTYIYELNGGTTKVIKLVGYDKQKEIEENRSKKKYIMETLPWDGSIYRLELRFQSQYLTSQEGKAWTLRFIFENLHNKEFLKEFFVTYIDKFYNLKINDRKVKISELLRLN